ncbi:hypothetical protein [Photobacterium leiognathi]|uniref:hypothetical protein n=1 Tax=Photobacterium leiognathi TaxID=553611 RepID=UPI002732FFB7|nr:hypothetical protein [Photobacterium leiognathi]
MKGLFKCIVSFYMFFMATTAQAEQECILIEDGETYTISPNIDICMDANSPVTLINSYEQNYSIFSIQSENSLQPQIMFPDEWVHIVGTFKVHFTEEMYLYRNGNILLFMDKVAVNNSTSFLSSRTKRSTGAGAIIGSGISNVDGGARKAGNAAVGAAVGHVVGVGVTAGTKLPVLGEIAAGVTGKLVTDHLNNNRAKTHPKVRVGRRSMGSFGGGMVQALVEIV